MPSSSPLADLLDVLQPSLAMYLADSGLWTYPGPEQLTLAVADLVADHRSLVERAGVEIVDRGGVAPSASYPIHFTGCHDAGIASLAPRILDGLRRQVERLDGIVAATAEHCPQADPVAHGLAREARDSSLAHRSALEQALAAARAAQRAAAP